MVSHTVYYSQFFMSPTGEGGYKAKAEEAQKGSSFLGPKWHAYRLDAITQGLKNSRFPGPNPLPLAQVMDAARIISITHGAVKHRCINSYFVIETLF